MGITRVKGNPGTWCLPHPALYLESRSCGPGPPAGPRVASLTEPMADAPTTIGILAAQPMHRSQKQGCGVTNSPNMPAFASHVTCSSPLCTASAHLSSYGGVHFGIPGFGHIFQGRNISFSLDRGGKKKKIHETLTSIDESVCASLINVSRDTPAADRAYSLSETKTSWQCCQHQLKKSCLIMHVCGRVISGAHRAFCFGIYIICPQACVFHEHIYDERGVEVKMQMNVSRSLAKPQTPFL
ncbi:hypothetical protein LZ31DRAFT_135669 [Colletotrichum somersetense]|nr:hypothetical protein LZ31DRAFT_135669 [Colletotrichum somersetense]